MPYLVTLSSYIWPTDEFALASLGVRVDDLARRLGLSLFDWEEDGLGCARGVAVQLPSARVALLREMAHAVEHLGATGPDVLVDAAEVAAVGVEPLLAEVREALGLTTAELAWVQVPEARESAADLAARAREYRARWRGEQAGGHRDPAV